MPYTNAIIYSANKSCYIKFDCDEAILSLSLQNRKNPNLFFDSKEQNIINSDNNTKQNLDNSLNFEEDSIHTIIEMDEDNEYTKLNINKKYDGSINYERTSIKCI